MASFRTWHCLVALFLLASAAHGQLSPSFYATTCPTLGLIVRATMIKALLTERRMGASLVRLLFHDCFVQGCDGSILLDDTGSFTGEKGAGPNANSVRGYEVIDQIKANVEVLCPGVVSCGNIVALASRDARRANMGGAARPARLDDGEPEPCQQRPPVAGLRPRHTHLGVRQQRPDCLSARDLTALSGAHTIGFVQCKNFRGHIYNDTDINAAFAALHQRTCPAAQGSGDSNLAPLDVQTQLVFDNAYYRNLVGQRGLLHSDQELFNGGSQDALVRQYSANPALFASDFAAAMVKMGNISPLTGSAGQIRSNCRVVNSS
ncbi:unnamed protein product [Urochloa decumbens]|uniref:Peroxidase n=1 Tax=Urochloa decumbens TaxID=240449 RepID=A0ABC9H5A7_9POAL